MSSSNIMIQLRQADANDITANGEYECMLSRDITIDNGDVVQLNKIFIDSVGEGDINIVEDLTLTIQSGVYITQWGTLTGNFINNQGENIPCTSDTASTAPCFKRFIPYLPVDNLEGYYNYLQYEYKLVYNGVKEPPFTMTYSYIDMTGLTQYFHTTIPSIPAGSYNQRFMDNFNIIALNGSLKIVSPSLAFLYSVGFTPVGPVGGPFESKLYTPFTFETNINLPKGIYSPTQISTYISQQLSQSNLSPNSTSETMNNSFFQFAITDFDTGKANPNGQINPQTGLPVLLQEQTTFISDDGILSYKFPINNELILGTSQIALEFNQETNTFQFTFLHLPMLDSSTGQNICVRYLNRGLVQNAGIYGVSENSGIYFNSLTAKTSSGRLVNFWDGVLGFDLNTLCVGINSQVIDKYGLQGVINLSDPLVDGVSSTSGYYGLDSAIIRGKAGTNGEPNTWYSRQSIPYFYGATPVATVQIALDGLCSTINSTNYISGVKTLDVLLNKFSHYILQTDLGFNNNNYIGEKWYRNVNGVINKFYSYGSYAYGSSDSAIQYVHSGSSIQLSSIRVRILKSDMTRDENLGEDNTVIMQIIKSSQTTQTNKT